MMDICRRGWLVVALALLAFASPVYAQGGTITGRLTASDTGRPLAKAFVAAITEGGTTVATTEANQDGVYRLTGLAAGSYRVSVSMIGYGTQTAGTVQLGAGSTETLNAALEPRAIELDPVVVSASKKAEKALDAPARVEVVGSSEIDVRPTVTPVDHLRGLAAVDIITQGLQSTNVVVRGFNNIFSGAVHALTDNRIAGVPSLRVNVMNFIPSNNEDLERIEVVLGPGSALYGPNTANGVVHLITKSPLRYQGTQFSVSGGSRDVAHLQFRTSHLLNENVGFKISGQYFRGNEWPYTDPIEAAEKTKFATDTNGQFRTALIAGTGISPAEADRRIARIGLRNYDLTRWSADARVDWRMSPELTSVFSAGRSSSSQIELTGLGAGQADGWSYSYVQAKSTWNRLFIQGYVNASDAGDTYLLRNGTPIVDQSKLWVAQIQHGFNLGDGQQFTYGGDLLYTHPDTKGSINGKYENDDNTTELGAYVQSETALAPKLDLVLAARVDHHSALPDAIFSPRAALVFKPAESHRIRLTFNRAFSTPSSLNQFLDLPTAVPSALLGQLGYGVRVQGTGETGFRFEQSGGGYLMRSPFTPGAAGGPAGLLPANAAAFWQAAVNVAAAQAAAMGSPISAQLLGYLLSLQPTSTDISTNYLNTVNGATGSLSSLSLPDVKPIREETSTTFELGYQGVLGTKLVLAADVWASRKNNLVTPLTTITPLLLLNGPETGAYLVTRLVQDLGMPVAQAQAVAGQLAPGLAKIPLGVVSSADVDANGAQLLATYVNVDKTIDLWGSDLSLTALLNADWSVGSSVSWVNDDRFEYVIGSDTTDVTLNAPKFKASASLSYRNIANGLSAETRVRYTDGFPASSGVYQGTACLFATAPTDLDIEPCVKRYTLIDLTADYRIPSLRGVSLGLSMSNLFGESYRSFPGVPDIGRTALLRLRYEF
jgi:outer membrane receptor for ferrienterochelin and colicins